MYIFFCIKQNIKYFLLSANMKINDHIGKFLY